MSYFKYFLILGLVLSSLYLNGQTYPQSYFQNPLNIPINLAGNYGECRPNHFHTGIDIKTNQKENLPVYAAAEGYVSRINISHSGYGNALYITHPNGYQTVYAHLNKYSPELQAFVTAQQKLQEKWNIDIEMDKGEFPVKKGELVAYSGNTGGSTAPHLHFEIRDVQTEEVLNPLLFGLDIKDNLPPILHSIAIYDASKSVHEQSPIIVSLIKKGNEYIPAKAQVEIPFKQFRIGIAADDKMNNSHNNLACYRMALDQDGIEKISWKLERLDFKNNRYVNAYADFKSYMNKKVWWQSLYRLPNNKIDFYEGGDGLLQIQDEESEIRIQAEDAFGNTSVARIQLRLSAQKPPKTTCSESERLLSKIETPNFKFSAPKDFIYDPFCWDYTTQPGNDIGYALQLMDRDVPLHAFADLSIKLKTIIPFDLRSKLYFIHQIKKQSLPGANAQPGMAVQYDNGWASGKIRTFGYFEVGIDTIAPHISIKSKNTLTANQKISFSVQENETSLTICKTWIDNEWRCFSRVKNTFTDAGDSSLNKGAHVLKILVKDENENERILEWNFTIQ